MQQNAGGDAPQALDRSQPLSGLHILVVDDEVDTRDLLTFILVEAGATVVAVSSALAALDALNQSMFHLLLSDIAMPGMDGYMLMQQVRSRTPETGSVIPAIALTAYASEADQERTIAFGFQKHLAKPVDPVELIVMVSIVATHQLS